MSSSNFESRNVFNAKAGWLDLPDYTSIITDVKDFTRFVCRVYGLPVEQLDVAKYAAIVTDRNFEDNTKKIITDNDQPALDAYLHLADSSRTFYVDYSVQCLTGRFNALRVQVSGKTA